MTAASNTGTRAPNTMLQDAAGHTPPYVPTLQRASFILAVLFWIACNSGVFQGPRALSAGLDVNVTFPSLPILLSLSPGGLQAGVGLNVVGLNVKYFPSRTNPSMMFPCLVSGTGCKGPVDDMSPASVPVDDMFPASVPESCALERMLMKLSFLQASSKYTCPKTTAISIHTRPKHHSAPFNVPPSYPTT